MSNYDQIKVLINSFSGQTNMITIPKIYIELTGEYHTGALLNQIVFWSDKTKRNDGLFYKTYQEWEEELGLSEYQIRRSVGVLKKLGFVNTEIKRANGSPTTHYKLEYEVLTGSILKKLNVPTTSNLSNQPKETKETITVDNTVDNTEDNKHTDIENDFEELWKLYPRKIGKTDALKHYSKHIKDGTTNEEIEQGIKNYIKEIEKNNTKTKYIKHGSTWFNQEGWKDKYEANDYTDIYNIPIL